MAFQKSLVTPSAFQVEWLMATTAFGMFVLMALVMSAASTPSSSMVYGLPCDVPAYCTKSPSSNQTSGLVGQAACVCWAYEAYMAMTLARLFLISAAPPVVRLGPFGAWLPSGRPLTCP